MITTVAIALSLLITVFCTYSAWRGLRGGWFVFQATLLAINLGIFIGHIIRMLAVAVLIAVTVTGCASEFRIGLNLSAADPWLVDDTAAAAEFWAGHGVTFEEDARGTIEVSAEEGLLPDRIGEYRGIGNNHGYVVLDVALEAFPALSACTVAHELGHAMGMEHTVKGLMAPVMELAAADGSCSWSAEDEAELCKNVIGLCDGGGL